MANVDGESPNLDDLTPPGSEPVPAEPAAAPQDQATSTGEAEAAAELPPTEPIEAMDTQAEAQQSEEEAEQEGMVEEEAKKEPGKLPVYLEWGCAIGIPIILLALAFFQILYFSTAIYIISVGFVPYGIWKGRETNTVYTVILGCVLVAVLTAIYCLWMEIGRYEFDIKARDAKHSIGMLQPIQEVDRRSFNHWIT